jgi:hypothetical protein
VYLEAAQATAEAERLPVLKSLDDLNINAPAMRGEAARNVALANRLVRDAVYMLDNYTVSSLQSDLTPTEGFLLTRGHKSAEQLGLHLPSTSTGMSTCPTERGRQVSRENLCR